MKYFKGQLVYDRLRDKKVILSDNFIDDCWFTMEEGEVDPEWYELGFEEDFEEVE